MKTVLSAERAARAVGEGGRLRQVMPFLEPRLATFD